MKRYTKGFTLIELLVVIAIIGILASVVLVSLQSARKKGNDSRVISDVQQLRTHAESTYDGSTYNVAFNNNQTVGLSTVGDAQANYVGIKYAAGSTQVQLANDAAGQGGGLFVLTPNNANVTSYSIYGALPSTKTSAGAYNYFCIASDGTTKQNTALTTGVGTCN